MPRNGSAHGRGGELPSQSEDFARIIVENLNEGLLIIDSGAVIAFLNEQMASMLGYERDEMLGKPLCDFLSARDAELVSKTLSSDLPCVRESGDFQFVRKDGGPLYTHFTVSPVQGDDGKFAGAIVGAVDITDRKLMEEGLRRARAELEEGVRRRTAELAEANRRLLDEVQQRRRIEASLQASVRDWDITFDAISDAVSVLDLDRKILRCNRAMAELVGKPVEQAVGLTCYEFMRWEPAHRRLCPVERMKKTRRRETLVYEFSGRWFAITADPVFSEDGELAGAVHIMRDITASVRANEELRRSQRGLAEAQRIAHLGNWEWDMASNEVRWSDEVRRMFHMAHEETAATYEDFIERVHPEDRARVADAIRRAVRDGGPFSVEHRVVLWDGSERFIQEIGEAVFDESGRAVRLVGTVQDITERKLAEQRIEDYQRELRSLASELSLAEERQRRQVASFLHDYVAQALALAKIKLGAVRESVTDPRVLAELAEVRSLVEQCIDYTRSLMADLSPPVLYEVGLEAALEELAAEIERRHGVTVEFQDDGQPKPVGEQMRVTLFQSARELLVNAIKHSDARRVRVCVRRDNEQIRVSVEDDGKGFDVREVGLRAVRGSGFGLFSVRERLDHVGGRLELQSAPGKGTSATLVAPLDPGAHAPAE